MAGGRTHELRTLLTVFEGMNKATIQDATALQQLGEAVASQKAVLEQLGS